MPMSARIDVGTIDGNSGDGLLAVAHGHHVDVFARECELDDALNRDAVVGKQQLVGHAGDQADPTRERGVLRDEGRRSPASAFREERFLECRPR
jgi:hypothetical protein